MNEDYIEEILADSTDTEIYIKKFGYFSYLLNFAMEFLYQGLELIQANGWFIVIGCALAYYVFNKCNFNMPRLNMPQQSRHRESDETEQLRQMQNIEAARLRQQAAMDAAAAKHKEDKKKKDELNALRKAEEWELHQQGLGYRSKTKAQTEEEEMAALGLTKKNLNVSSKPKMRNEEYNPLTGQSSSGASCQRPTFRRGQPSRGG